MNSICSIHRLENKGYREDQCLEHLISNEKFFGSNPVLRLLFCNHPIFSNTPLVKL